MTNILPILFQKQTFISYSMTMVLCLLSIYTTTVVAMPIEEKGSLEFAKEDVLPMEEIIINYAGSGLSPLFHQTQGMDVDAILIQGLLSKGLWYQARNHALKSIVEGKVGITALGTLVLTAAITNDKATLNATLKKLQSIGNENYFLPLSRGIMELQAGKPDQAKTYLQGALNQYPQDPIAQYFYAELLNQQGKPARALALLQDVLKTTPNFAPALFAAARLHSRESVNTNAISMMEKAVDIDPGNAAYRRRLAELYERAGQHEKSREILIDLVKNIPGVKESYLNSAWQLLHAGNAEQALRQIDKTYELFGPSSLGYLIGAMANIDLGNTNKIEPNLKAYLESENNKGQAHFAIGLCHLALGNAENARRDFQQTLKTQPNNMQALLNLAVANQLHSQFKQAELSIEKAVQGGEDINIINFIRAHLELGRGNIKRYQQLLEDIESILPGLAKADLSVEHLSDAEKNTLAILRNVSFIMLLNKWDSQVLSSTERIIAINERDPIALYFRQMIEKKRNPPLTE